MFLFLLLLNLIDFGIDSHLELGKTTENIKFDLFKFFFVVELIGDLNLL